MKKSKVLHIYHKRQLPVHVRYFVRQSSLEYIILSEDFIGLTLLNLELKSQLRPLFLGQQVISLGVVSHLNQFQFINLFEERVGSFFFEQSFNIFEHGLGEGALEDDFVGTLVGVVKVCVDL